MDGLFEIVNPLSLVLHLVNLVILYIVFKKFLYKPVAKFLKDRQDKIAQERASVDQDRAEVDALKAKGDGILDDARTQAEGQAAQIMALPKLEKDLRGKKIEPAYMDAVKQAKEILENARQEAEEEKKRQKDAIHDQVMELSVALAGRILEREINPKDHQKLMEEFLSEVK